MKLKNNNLVEDITPIGKNISAMENIQNISEQLLCLMKNANVLYETINQQEQLSRCSGLLIRSLHSDCNVSYEKMPLVVHLVLTMIFGKLNVETYQRLESASSTYTIAADRTSDLIEICLFTDRNRIDRVIIGHIRLDGSEKKKQAYLHHYCLFLFTI